MRRETEAGFQRSVVELAGLLGWWCYHTRDSRGSTAGLPDLLLVKGSRLIWAELKTETGRLSAAQRDVIERLRAAGQVVYLWRPSMWDEIKELLGGTP